jgi:hypothetical protein
VSEGDVEEDQERLVKEPEPEPAPPEVKCSGGLSLPPLSGGNGGE